VTKFGRYLPSEHTLKQRERTQRAIQIDNQRKEKADKMGFDLQNYETVADRLVRWWQTYPEGRIETHIYFYDGTRIVMRAEGFNNEDRLVATGYAEEIISDRGVNMTSFCENCETSCIGRMIQNSPVANAGLRPSREEMQKVERTVPVRAVIGSAQAVPKPQPSAGAFVSPKQQTYIKALARGKGWDEGETLEQLHSFLGVNDVILETLTASQASRVIEAWK
tara:strand:- start:591 stop:1256 length:666 start_codon:yes stop_codon:yes gene_type:complete